jgi:hypothetical protein
MPSLLMYNKSSLSSRFYEPKCCMNFSVLPCVLCWWECVPKKRRINNRDAIRTRLICRCSLEVIWLNATNFIVKHLRVNFACHTDSRLLCAVIYCTTDSLRQCILLFSCLLYSPTFNYSNKGIRTITRYKKQMKCHRRKMITELFQCVLYMK